MAAFLFIPFLLIRFGLLSLLSPTAIQRAAHFPPLQGREKVAYWLYQLSNVAIFIYPFFLKIIFVPQPVFLAGVFVYLLGNVLLIISICNFALPSQNGINKKGIYRLSRNPMYLAYFVCFLGCALLTQSIILLILVLVFQICAHWMILSEERWCIQTFGEEYLSYMKKVRRYL